MKCSAVRKDFWCLTNKVNQIIRNSPCSSVTLFQHLPVGDNGLVATSDFCGSILIQFLTKMHL